MALAMVGLIGFLALAFDGGNAYAQRRLVQNTTDAAALAGARALAGEGDVQAAIYKYAERNGMDAANISWSYIDEDEEHVGVAVTTTTTFPTFFASVIGVPSISASAVSWAQLVSLDGYAVFNWVLCASNSHQDRAITIDANNLTVEGSVHSNGGIYIAGNNNTIAGGTESVRHFYLNGNNNILSSPLEVTGSGGYDIDGQNNSYPVPSYTANRVEIPPYNLSDYGPGKLEWVPEAHWHYYSGDWSFTPNNKILTGVYYVEGDITLSGNHLSGQATFIATGHIKLQGNHYSFTPYDERILLFAHGSIEINGNNMDLSGITYAPQGRVTINGNSLSVPLNGSVIGDTIEINGNSAHIVYDLIYFAGERSIRLVQ